MNSKLRALLWEECRVGGVIAGMMLITGVMVFISMLDVIGGMPATRDMLLFVTLAVPLLTALLLTFNVGNSGQLKGGFSRRVLRLPVDTRLAVTVTLLARLTLVLLQGAVILTLCRLMFDLQPRHSGGALQEPGLRPVIAFGIAYLVIQVLDWMRAVAPVISGGFVVMGVVLALLFGHWEGWIVLAGMDAPVTLSLLAGFAALTAAAWAAGLWLAARTRCGETLPGTVLPRFQELWGEGKYTEKPPFASPEAALYWWEMRRLGLLMPLVALAVWVFGLVLIIGEILMSREPQFSVGGISGTLLFEWLPLAAVLAASLPWDLKGAVHFGWGRARLPMDFERRLPAPAAARANARLRVMGLSLALLLGVAGTVQTAHFLFSGDGAGFHLLADGLAAGSTDWREVLTLLLGPALTVGLASWIFMTSPAWVTSLAVALFLIYTPLRQAQLHLLKNSLWGARLIDTVWGLAVVFLLFLTVLHFLNGLRRMRSLNLSSRRATAALLLVWPGVALLFYPWSARMSLDAAFQAALICLTLSALVLQYRNSALPGVVWRGWLKMPVPEELPGATGGNTRAASRAGTLLRVVLLLGLLPGLVWLRWPAESARMKMLRANGFPANLEELNDWYAAVPAAENLAERYAEAFQIKQNLEAEWQVAARKSGNVAVMVEHLLGQEQAVVEREELVPEGVWNTSLDYWRAVGEPVAALLHESARSGLTQSRYPVDLRRGNGVLLDHLSIPRGLARALSLEAWVAAVEKRPTDAATAILDIFPVGDSLAGEPILISQLVRTGTYGIACGALETVMNRTRMPEAELLRLREGFERALPPRGAGPLFERAMAGEEAMALGTNLISTLMGEPASGYRRQGRQPLFSLGWKTVFGVVFWDISGLDRLNGVMMRHFQHDMLVKSRLALLQDKAPTEAYWQTPAASALLAEPPVDFSRVEQPAGNQPRMDRIRQNDGTAWRRNKTWEGLGNTAIFLRAPQACMAVTGLIRVHNSEWRIRTQFDLCRTALAVERYRLANGRLPERLEELVPQYLDRVPPDPWNDGRPLSYRVREDGGYVVYSYALNREDDGGVEGNSWGKGDMTFTVCPPEIRDRVQVAGGQ